MRSTWFWLVIGLGSAQATLSVASVLAFGQDALCGPSADGIATCLISTVVAIIVPFLAYAADSSRMLAGCAYASQGRWQAVGGLIGMVLSLGLLHATVVLTGHESAGTALVYRLVFPPFIVGCLGAATGTLLALAAYALFHGRAGAVTCG